MSINKFCIFLTLIFALPVQAETIAVIGTGNVGSALGTELAIQGHAIIYGSRSPMGLKALDLAKKTEGNAKTATAAEAAAEAEIIVLAVPGMLALALVEDLGDLSGKLVIDATNPLIVEQPMKFVFGVETSNGEMIQEAAPDALVVKAFNSISTQLMISPENENGPVYVTIVGNDSAAKERVAGFATAMGLVPIDLGPIEVAHWTEYAVVVGLNNQFSERPNYDIVFREKEMVPDR
jgi:NADPH-dependent F420 reductase